MNSTIHNANTKTMGDYFRSDRRYSTKSYKRRNLSKLKHTLKRQGRKLNKRIPLD